MTGSPTTGDQKGQAMDVITLTQIECAGACDEGRDLFVKLFGDRVTVTEGLALQHTQTFDWSWASEALLDPDAGTAYNEALKPSREAYREAIESAYKACNEVVKPARWAHYKAVDSAFEAYTKGSSSSLGAYHEAVTLAEREYHYSVERANRACSEAITSAREVYNEARSVAFARAYLSM